MGLAMDALKEIPCRQLHIVLGNGEDKDQLSCCAIFLRRVYFARPDIPRTNDAELLRESRRHGLAGALFSSTHCGRLAATPAPRT